MEKYNVVIIGAGPAGICCAETLLENGVEDVHIFEKQENVTKICNGMMVPINNASLKIPKEDCDDYISTIDIFTNKNRLEISSTIPFLYLIDRVSGGLGNYLVERALKEGIHVHLGEEVKKINKLEKKIITSKDTYGYEKLVIATGSPKFRAEFNLKPQKSAIATNLRVPIDELPDKREHVGHIYLMNPTYYSGYSVIKDQVDFCHVFFNPIQFETETFFAKVKQVEGIDLSKYKMLSKLVHYGGNIAKTRVYLDTWFIGDANGYGDVFCGLIGTCAESGKVAALEIANKIDKANQEIKKYKRQYPGHTQIIAKIARNWPKSLYFLAPRTLDLLIENKFLIKFLIKHGGKKGLPLPGDEYGEFDREYYKRVAQNIEIKR